MSKSNRHQTHFFLKKKISDSTTGKYQNNENHIVTAQHEKQMRTLANKTRHTHYTKREVL